MIYVAGSVRGGTQLQDFTSVGDKSHATNTGLILTHVAQVFVTVTARNRAGLVSVAYSKPVIVDFTPPEILFVREKTHSLQGKFIFASTFVPRIKLSFEIKVLFSVQV